VGKFEKKDLASVLPDIFANSHAGNNLFDSIAFLSLLGRIQGNLQLEQFTYRNNHKSGSHQRNSESMDPTRIEICKKKPAKTSRVTKRQQRGRLKMVHEDTFPYFDEHSGKHREKSENLNVFFQVKGRKG
jgi:hypothetical protein